MRSILVGVLLLMVGACETLEFYGQAVSGQLAILRAKQSSDGADRSRRRPIPHCARNCSRWRRCCDFAQENLALDPKRRYSSYAHIDRKYVVWNVFATPEFSTDPIRWCYPIAGCATYRGYFSQSDASDMHGN